MLFANANESNASKGEKTMLILQMLSVITVLFVLFGLVLSGIVIWKITTRRDELYEAKYQRFLEQRRRAAKRLQKNRSK